MCPNCLDTVVETFLFWRENRNVGVKAVKHFSGTGILRAVALAAFGLVATVATAGTVNAVWNSATDVPVTASGYTATGNTVNFTLNFAPATGTDLMVVSNTALPFIVGRFDNLAQGQGVTLSYGGTNYQFVANYYGGSGNDLVLVWASNRAFAWGHNNVGQLGDFSKTDRHMAVPVSASVLVGGGTTPLVTLPGVLAGKMLLAIAAGQYHSLALCSDGMLAAWGYNYDGELGDNTSKTNRLVPVAVNTAPGVSALYGKTVVALAAGGWHSVALCSDGTVAAWGENSGGELGDGTIVWRYAPVAVNTNSGVSALYGKTVVAIAVGYSHNLALCSDGTLAGWGGNSYGQLGNNGIPGGLNVVPVAVNTNSGVSALYGKTVVALAAGYNHSLALCSDGTVAAWGANFYGQLGDNTGGQTGDKSLVPVAVSTNLDVSALYGKTVVAVAAGGWHSLALCSDGTVATWGRNDYGQLGDNTTNSSLVPVAVSTNLDVSALYGKTVVALAAGQYHSLALCSDGTLAAWGANTYGALGDNTTAQRNAPVAVDTTPLAASQRFACVSSGPMADHTLALVTAPPAAQIILTGGRRPVYGGFSFTFTNTPGAFFGVLAATNLALPLSNWTPLDGLTEVSPGQFQFEQQQFWFSPRRFYRVRSP